MALLKSQQATPAIKEAVVLDLGDVGAQAAKIRAAAEAKAERDPQRGGAEGRRDHRGRRAEGLRAGPQPRGTSRASRRAAPPAGRRRFRSGAKSCTSSSPPGRTSPASGMRSGRTWTARPGTPCSSSPCMAEKLIHRAIEVDPTVVVDQLAQALSHVLRPLDVTVRTPIRTTSRCSRKPCPTSSPSSTTSSTSTSTATPRSPAAGASSPSARAASTPPSRSSSNA